VGSKINVSLALTSPGYTIREVDFYATHLFQCRSPLSAMDVFDGGSAPWDLGWLQNFPDLQSLSLLIGSRYIPTYTDGKILLYEPEEFRMMI
jgi:hypothetical protein